MKWSGIGVLIFVSSFSFLPMAHAWDCATDCEAECKPCAYLHLPLFEGRRCAPVPEPVCYSYCAGAKHLACLPIQQYCGQCKPKEKAEETPAFEVNAKTYAEALSVTYSICFSGVSLTEGKCPPPGVKRPVKKSEIHEYPPSRTELDRATGNFKIAPGLQEGHQKTVREIINSQQKK